MADTYVNYPDPISVSKGSVEDAIKADGSLELFKIYDIEPRFSKEGGDWEAHTPIWAFMCPGLSSRW
jgi:hypothetical protein